MPLTRSQQNSPSTSTDPEATISPSASNVTTSSQRNTNELNQDAQPLPGTRASLRIPDNAVPYFKSARRALQSRIRADHHVSYLTFCLDNNTTPRGLQNRIPPAIPDQNFNFLIKWETAHNDFASELTRLLRDYYNDRSLSLQQQYDLCISEITLTCTPEVHQYIISLLDKIKIDLHKELEERRARKGRRDAGASSDTT